MNQGTPIEDEIRSVEAAQLRKNRIDRGIDVLLWIAALVSLALIFRSQSSGPDEGSRLTPMELPLVGQAGTYSISPRPGKKVLIEAFAGWCGACRRASYLFPEFEKAEKSGSLEVVYLNVDDTMVLALEAKDDFGMTGRVVHDANGRFQRKHGITALPTYLLVEPDGTISDVSVGVPGRAIWSAWLSARD